MNTNHKQRFAAAEARLLATTPGGRRELWAKDDDPAEPVAGDFRESGFPALDAIARASGARFLYGGNEAFTMRNVGTVTLPEPERFYSPQDYARTVAHELSHWTGWEGELNRPVSYMDPIRELFGMAPENYPREEMTAEIAAALLLDAADVPHDLSYSIHYFLNWEGAMRMEPGATDEKVANARAWAKQHAEEAAELLLNRAGL